MPRPTWANDEQTAFLTERKKGFTDAQAGGTSHSFLNSTSEEFIRRWPVEPPTDIELGEQGGDMVAAKEKKLTKYRKRIEHWLRNHTRANASGTTNAKTAVLSLAPKRAHVLLPYQAYMCLFRQRVMHEIGVKYVEYKATLSAGAETLGWWKFAIQEADRLLARESDDVKSQVETFRKRPAQKVKAEPIDNAKLEGMDSDEAAEKVHALQQAINLLPRTGQEALKAIEAQTGFYGVLLVGGPNPETGRLVTLAIHNGRTLSLKNLFSDASEQWPVVQSAFDNFIARCFEPDLPGKLEKVYRGESPSAPSTDTQPGLSAPETTLTPAAAMSAPATSIGESSLEEEDESDEELDYDKERQKTVARNQIIMQRMKAGETMDEILQSIDMDLAEDEEPDWLADGLPEWIEEAQEYLKGVCEEEWWMELLKEWVAFERALGFPDGQVQRNWLATKARPEEVKYWIGRGRQYDRPPKIKSVPTFVTGWRQWWVRLQPSVRRDKDTTWPLLRELPASNNEWAQLKRGGWNGLFMVVMTLSWWIQALNKDDASDDVQEAVDDVKWACIAMTEPSRSSSPAVASPASALLASAPPSESSASPTSPASPSSATALLGSVPSTSVTPAAPTPSLTTAVPALRVSSLSTPAPSTSTASPSPAPTLPAPALPATTSPAFVSPTAVSSAPVSPVSASPDSPIASSGALAPTSPALDNSGALATSSPAIISAASIPLSPVVCATSLPAVPEAREHKIPESTTEDKEDAGADSQTQGDLLGGGDVGGASVAGEGTSVVGLAPVDSSASLSPSPTQGAVMLDTQPPVAQSPSSADVMSSNTTLVALVPPNLDVTVSAPPKRVAPEADESSEIQTKKARVQ